MNVVFQILSKINALELNLKNKMTFWAKKIVLEFSGQEVFEMGSK